MTLRDDSPVIAKLRAENEMLRKALEELFSISKGGRLCKDVEMRRVILEALKEVGMQQVWCPECQDKMIYSHTVVKELENHFQRGEVWVCKPCRITRFMEGDQCLETQLSNENKDSNNKEGE